MATITISLASGVVNGSKSFTLSDADVQRLINAALVAFPPRNADGSTIQNPTNAQILASWATEWIDRTKRIVKNIETAPPAEISVA